MRWLIIQSDGEHKGQDKWCPNWFLRECYAIQHALHQNGQEADIWGLRHANLSTPPDFNNYDIIFVLENYEFNWIPDLSQFKCPLKLQWIVDLHCAPAESFLPLSRQCDVILHATKKLISGYPGSKSALQFWFPSAVDDRFFNLHHQERTPHLLWYRPHDIIFVGSPASSRKAILDRMTSETGMQQHYGVTGQDYISVVMNSKMQFNKPINGDLNYRTWETIGLGACLLTEADPCLDELGFRHGVNCLMYSSVDEAVELARSALAGGSWLPIAKAGYVLSKRHSYGTRIRSLISQLRYYCGSKLTIAP